MPVIQEYLRPLPTTLGCALWVVVCSSCADVPKTPARPPLAPKAAPADSANAPPANAPPANAPPVASEQRKAAEPVLLLRRWSGSQAELLARFRGTEVDALADLAPERGAGFVTAREALRSPSLGSSTPGAAVFMTGKSRIACDAVFVELDSADAAGEILIGGRHPLVPRPVEPVAPSKETLARLAEAVPAASDLSRQAPNELEAFRVDLDGDGAQEVVLQVTGAMREDESFDYSVVAVVPETGAVDVVGYQASEESDQHLAQLWAIADVNGDGSMELVVLHSEPWLHYHRQFVYAWDDELRALVMYRWAESDCHPDLEWSP